MMVKLCIERCVRPSLEIVDLTASVPDEDIFHLMKKGCPQLKEISLNVGMFNDSSVSDQAVLIHSCKSLRSMYL